MVGAKWALLVALIAALIAPNGHPDQRLPGTQSTPTDELVTLAKGHDLGAQEGKDVGERGTLTLEPNFQESTKQLPAVIEDLHNAASSRPKVESKNERADSNAALVAPAVERLLASNRDELSGQGETKGDSDECLEISSRKLVSHYADRIQAGASVVMAILTGIGVLLLCRTLKATNRTLLVAHHTHSVTKKSSSGNPKGS